MSKVFVSHASADKSFLDPFVKEILKLGCELSNDEIFYSSGAGTGVPSGSDLMSYVRKQAADASLVVALISPTYQTRPVCMAELGAAWGVVGKLFPLLTPGMDREDLEGVLPPMLIKHMDDRSALDELHDVVGASVGHVSAAVTWNDNLQSWLASVDRRAKKIPVPEIVSQAQWRLAQADLASALAVADKHAERVEVLEGQVESLKQLKDADDAAEILLPVDEMSRFEVLAGAVQSSITELDRVMAEAIRYEVLLGQNMPLPSADEDYSAHQLALRLLDDGELIDPYDNGTLTPDYDFPNLARAKNCIEDLVGFMDADASPDFVEWFIREFEVPFDLTKRRTWDAIVARRWGAITY